MQVAKMYLITNITIYDVIAVRLVCAPVLLCSFTTVWCHAICCCPPNGAHPATQSHRLVRNDPMDIENWAYDFCRSVLRLEIPGSF